MVALTHPGAPATATSPVVRCGTRTTVLDPCTGRPHKAVAVAYTAAPTVKECLHAALRLYASSPGASGLPTLLGVALPPQPGVEVDEDFADAVMGAFGYAWKVHGDPTRTGLWEEGRVLWSADGLTFSAPCDLTSRRSVSRTPGEAMSDLVNDALTYLFEGAPQRRDGTRLFEAPLLHGSWQDVSIYFA